METVKVITNFLRIVGAAKKPLQRTELFVRILKACKLEAEHPPAEFNEVYAYTLVEYGLAEENIKPKALLELFAEPEIKAAFKKAFDSLSPQFLDEAVSERLSWHETARVAAILALYFATGLVLTTQHFPT